MGLFDRFKKKEEEPVTVIDPEIEKLREEKFNAPVIEDEEEVKEEVKPAAPKPYSNMNLGKNVSTAQSTDSPYSIYKSREIISPMMGRTEKKVEEEVKTKPNKKKVTYTEDDSINPVFSPFYGAQIKVPEKKKEEKSVEVKAASVEKVQTKSKAEIKAETKVNTSVEVKTEIENKSEIKTQPKEESKPKKTKKDTKKDTESKIEAAIVEQSTGEFKLDFPEEKNEDGKLMEEIGDEMTLDELLSLYENRKK